MPHCLSRWASIACVLDTHMIFNCLIIWTKPLIRVKSTTSRSSSTNKKEKLNKETLALKYSKNQLNFNHHVFNYILAKDLSNLKLYTSIEVKKKHNASTWHPPRRISTWQLFKPLHAAYDHNMLKRRYKYLLGFHSSYWILLCDMTRFLIAFKVKMREEEGKNNKKLDEASYRLKLMR